jgi:hypothetical protein
MKWLKDIPMGALVIIVGVVIGIAWIAFDGTAPLIISIAGGGLIAVRGVLEAEDENE